MLAAAFLLGGCATMVVAPGFYDAAPLDDPVVGRCASTRNYGTFVFRENDRIPAYLPKTSRSIGARFRLGSECRNGR